MNAHVKHVAAHMRHLNKLAENRIRKNATRATLALVALLSVSFGVTAQTAPPLGSTSTFGVVSSTYTNSNTAPQTIINGDVCFTTGPTTPPLAITGTTTTPCAPATGTDQGLALANLNGQACTSLGAGPITLDSVSIGGGPPGLIPPGCYSSGGAMNVTATTTVTLNGPGVYIFRPGGALTTGANSRVILAGGACASDVFWAPVGGTTIGANASLSPTPTFVGNIFRGTAAGLSITLGKFANLTGRALAFGSTVTTDSNTMSVPTCAPFVTPTNPTVAKAFFPATIGAGGIATLTVTLSNPTASTANLTAPLTDNLPAGVVIAAVPNLTSSCSGAAPLVAVPGSSSVTLPTARSIPSNNNCNFTVDVTAAAAGIYPNTIPAGALQTTNGSNLAPASATLTVLVGSAPPIIDKAFTPANINAGAVSSLTIFLNNANATVATLTAPFTDNLPAGVVIAPAPNAATTCGGVGAPVAVAGGSSVTLPAGRSIPGNGGCTLSVDVTAAAAGSYVNTIPAGALMTSGGNNVVPDSATLTVFVAGAVPPTLAKAFSPASISTGGVSTLTITLNNASATIATLNAALVDTLPAQVLIAATPNATTTCGGAGALVAAAGGATVTLPAGRTIPANGSCTLSVNVTSAVVGAYVNTLPAGTLVTSNGVNAVAANATLTVVALVAVPVPTLSEWAMILLAGLMAFAGFAALRRQEK